MENDLAAGSQRPASPSAFGGHLPLWKVFWLIFLPALLLMYCATAGMIFALIKLNFLSHLELASFVLASLSLAVTATMGVMVWRCAFNAKHPIWSYLARCVPVIAVASLGYNLIDWTIFSSSVLSEDTPRIHAARDFAYCSAYYAIASRASNTEERRKSRNDDATMFNQYATLLSNTLFVVGENQKAIEKIFQELKESDDPGKVAARNGEFCIQSLDRHEATLNHRIAQLNTRLMARMPWK
jgi:hypothetical protein